MNDDQQFSVPVEAVAPIIAEQRSAALDQAAQWQALAMQLKAERDQLAAEVEKLRADADRQGLSAVTVHTPNGESTFASRTT